MRCDYERRAKKTDHFLAKRVLYSNLMTYATQSHAYVIRYVALSHATTQRANAFSDISSSFFLLLSLIAWTPKTTGVLSQKCFRKRSLQDAWIFSTSTKQQSSVLCPSSRALWYLVTTCGSSQLLFKNEKKRKEKESFSFNST